jgi:replicative DNA helicase
MILGAILAGHRNRELLLEQVRPSDFFVTQNHYIARALERVRNAKRPVDLLTVNDELRMSGELEQAGGCGYLAELGDGMPTGLNLDYHIRSLKNLSTLRALIRIAHATQEAAYDVRSDAGALLDQAIEEFSSIARDAEADRDEIQSYRAASAELLEGLGKPEELKIFTGLAGLDELTGGFRPGELVVFTGGTGHGKTLLVQQTRRRACHDGHHSLFCSGEMLATHLVARELATAADVKPWKMRVSSQLTRDDWRALVTAAGHQCDRCQILDRELTLTRIRRIARRMKGGCGLELLIVDYDELVSAAGKDEFEQQRTIVRGLKSLGMELACAVILVSQLRKPLTRQDVAKPTLYGLYGSGAKSKHSSCVVYVDRPFVRDFKGDESDARVIVLKHRDGRVGRVEARFNVETLRFETPSPSER